MLAPAPTGQGVPAPVVFTTDGLPPARRVEAWNAAFGALNAITVPNPDGDGVGTLCENRPLGAGMVLSVTRVSPTRFARDAARARRDWLDHWVLRVLRRGESRLRHPGFTARLGPGEPVLFSMHETWEAEWTEAEWVSLCISRDLHPQLSAGLGAMPPGPLRGAGAGLLADLMLALPRRLATAAAAEVPVLAEATRATIAACLLTGTPSPPAIATNLAKERVRQAIRRHIGSTRLTPERLAAAAGLSRSALYRLFEAEGGVAAHIRDLRLSLVHAALREPASAGSSIAEIAAAHGFPEPSAFSRAFRQAFGATPGEVRAAGLPGPAPPREPVAPAAPPSGMDGDFTVRLYGAPGR
ncbi:helix-turn-helix domain-containing protein [Dankookia sp. P2]|uniref:helix-turn-helix domain-containing protein n=1 Tax=Dankookia sp. P2 TaxID=3423955 RepID=UPI003D671580